MGKQGAYSRSSRFKWLAWLMSVSVIAGLLVLPGVALAKVLETTIHAILVDSAEYTGKTLTVEGLVKNLKEDCSQKDHYYTTFELTAAHSTAAIQVLARKRLDVKEGDYVRVTGRYKQKADCPPCCWQGLIDAATVTKTVQSTCK